MFWSCLAYILSVSSAVLVSWNHLMQMHVAVSYRACVAALKQEGLYAWHSALPYLTERCRCYELTCHAWYSSLPAS